MSCEDNFYGITLDATTKSVTWNLNTDSKEYPSPFYKLVIRQILLGHQAKDNEFNVVEVETSSISADEQAGQSQIKIPVAILKAGETRSIQTVLEFPDMPVTFKLVEGDGPVYLHGLQVPGNYELESTDGLEEEELEDEMEIKKEAKYSKVIGKNGKMK